MNAKLILPSEKLEAMRRPSGSILNKRSLNVHVEDPIDFKAWENILNQFDKDRNSPFHGVIDFFWDEYGAFHNFVFSMVFNFQMLFVMAIATASPVFFYYYTVDGHNLAYSLNWTIISVAVLFPLSLSLSGALERRQQCIAHLATFGSNLKSCYMAHADWDWFSNTEPNKPTISGRQLNHKVMSLHMHKTNIEFCRLIEIFRLLLSAPRVNMGRNFYTDEGKQLRNEIENHIEILSDEITRQYRVFNLLQEELKEYGMNPSEVTRLRAFATQSMTSAELLKASKVYRTPFLLRSFSRVFILITPIMFGPYYADVANSLGLVFTVFVSILTTMSMQGLYLLRHELEDPFNAKYSLANIDYNKELDSILKAIDMMSNIDVRYQSSSSLKSLGLDETIMKEPPVGSAMYTIDEAKLEQQDTKIV